MKSKKRQSNSIPIYRADGQAIVGRVEGDTFKKRLRSTVHQLRRPPAWACDVDALDAAQAEGATRVEIFDLDTGRTFSADLTDFYRHGVRVSRGHGVQLALPLGRWSVNGRPSAVAGAGQPTAGGPVQLGLFEGARG